MSKRSRHRPSQQEIIRDCAKNVCEHLAEEHGASYATPEVVYGLTAFLEVVITILTKPIRASCEREEKVANPKK